MIEGQSGIAQGRMLIHAMAKPSDYRRCLVAVLISRSTRWTVPATHAGIGSLGTATALFEIDLTLYNSFVAC
jgi:hypothetical protein